MHESCIRGSVLGGKFKKKSTRERERERGVRGMRHFHFVFAGDFYFYHYQIFFFWGRGVEWSGGSGFCIRRRFGGKDYGNGFYFWRGVFYVVWID